MIERSPEDRVQDADPPLLGFMGETAPTVSSPTGGSLGCSAPLEVPADRVRGSGILRRHQVLRAP